MVNVREKTLSYRRVEWLKAGRTFQSFVQEACTNLSTVDDRTIVRTGGQTMRIAKCDLKADRILIHTTIETPGESASVVPAANGSDEVDVRTMDPPNDAEFMDGDAFLLISGNDVVLCATSVRDGAIIDLFRKLFLLAKLSKDAQQFNLNKIADADKLRLIQSSNVASIELRAKVYQASADYARRKTQAISLSGAVAKHVKAIFGSEHDVTKDVLQTSVVIKVDGRDIKHRGTAEERLEQLAIDLVNNQEEEDHYIIHLRNW